MTLVNFLIKEIICVSYLTAKTHHNKDKSLKFLQMFRIIVGYHAKYIQNRSTGMEVGHGLFTSLNDKLKCKLINEVKMQLIRLDEHNVSYYTG